MVSKLAVASLAGGITGGNISNAQIAGVAGMNAVENNNIALQVHYEHEQELRDTILLFDGDEKKA